MAVDSGSAVKRRMNLLLASGWFEVPPATLLLLIAATFNIAFHQPWPALALDAATCLAAALTGRFPRAAGIALAGGLALYLAIPTEWATLGEYAPIISILGAGMRQRRRTQQLMAIGYGTLLIAVTAYEARDPAEIIPGAVAWLALLAIVWLIGHAFVTVTRAHEIQRANELRAQRQRLAGQLHDTVARSLTISSRLVDRMQRQGSATADDLELLARTTEDAHRNLRLAMTYLADPANAAGQIPSGSTSLAEALQAGKAMLDQHGFRPAIRIDGDLGSLTETQSSALADAVDEVFANVMKHGDPANPVAIEMLITTDLAELNVLNQVRAGAPSSSEDPLGLAAIRQRLAAIGGTVNTNRQDSRWQTQLLLPLGHAR